MTHDDIHMIYIYKKSEQKAKKCKKAKSEAKCPRPLRGLQVDFSLTRNVSYAVRYSISAFARKSLQPSRNILNSSETL